jgi:hypothetical protein
MQLLLYTAGKKNSYRKAFENFCVSAKSESPNGAPVTAREFGRLNQQIAEPIDAVYTWVDDSAPGFQEQWKRYASDPFDHDPLRMRDNLDLLKYNLRSLATYAPWVRHIYIVTCRPQVPRWLNTTHPKLSIVHHDEFIEEKYLPTFNSFAIASFIGNIPNLSQRLLYLNDDMLFDSPVTLDDFVDESGRARIFPRIRWTRRAKMRHRNDISPWNTSLAYANYLLNTAFGTKMRHAINHVPLLVDLNYWQEMIERWPEDYKRTRESRFRAKYNVAHGHLYPYFLLETERARMESFYRSYRDVSFCKLGNSIILTGLQLASMFTYRRKISCLNDEFGAAPGQTSEAMAKAYLEHRYPRKSPYEI